MKITFFISAAMILLFPPSIFGKEVRVITTTEDLAAISREVGGDRVRVESLARGFQDAHYLEARPSQILKASKADLFIQVGLGLEEAWVPSLLVASRNPGIQPGTPGHLDVSAGIRPRDIPSGPVDRSQGDVHPLGNPHYWLDPENGKIIAKSIADRLKKLLPEQAGVFEKNLRDFFGRMDAAILDWSRRMAPYQGIKVISYHNSWSYFAERFGLEVVDFVEPKPGIPPSPSHLKGIINRIKREGVRLILVEPYVNRSYAELLSRETGAKTVVLPPSVGGVKGVEDYPGLFHHLILRISSALEERSG